MKRLNTLALAGLLALASGHAARAQSQPQTTTTTPPVDVIGMWDVTVNTQQGPIPSQLLLRKDGAKIVGTISSQMGSTPIEAEVKDKTLSIWFNFAGQNGPVAIEMVGTLEGDKIKGSMSAGGSVAGDWIATRAKSESTTAKTEAGAAASSTANTMSLTGDWNVSVELPNMTANPGITLKQDGEKLTGDYVSAQYGKFPITGTVKGTAVSFSFQMSIEGSPLAVTYTGTVEKDGSLKGTVNYGDMMSGTFTATRKKQ